MCLIEPRTKQNSLYVENPLDKAFPVQQKNRDELYAEAFALIRRANKILTNVISECEKREVWGGK